MAPQVLAESTFCNETKNVLPLTDGFCSKISVLLRLNELSSYIPQFYIAYCLDSWGHGLKVALPMGSPDRFCHLKMKIDPIFEIQWF
jgi:hypothetical protein